MCFRVSKAQAFAPQQRGRSVFIVREAKLLGLRRNTLGAMSTKSPSEQKRLNKMVVPWLRGEGSRIWLSSVILTHSLKHGGMY